LKRRTFIHTILNYVARKTWKLRFNSFQVVALSLINDKLPRAFVKSSRCQVVGRYHCGFQKLQRL